VTPPSAERVAAVRIAVRHPLATRRGMVELGLILAAAEHWRPLTQAQRTALRLAVKASLAAPGPAEGTPRPLPELPADTHPATVRSLKRRGLVADGRLTALAVDVVAHAVDRRPIRTITTDDRL
jgi:hypothetical protein